MLYDKKLTTLAAVLLLGIGTGCTFSASPQKSVEKWFDQNQAAYQTDINEDRSSIVLYREQNAIEGPTVNISVNGEYLASLQPNAYRQVEVCPQHQRLFAEFTNQDDAYKAKAIGGDYYDLPEGAVSFFKITANLNGKPSLVAVTPEQAASEMKGVKQQVHTLARVDKNTKCNQVLKKYTLQASALFAFDRADYANMLAKGKQEIVAVANDIKANPNHISNISVIGHTDPEGNAQYNQNLSLERAATVKQALADGGVNAQLIAPEGRGKQELLVTDCRQKNPKNPKARKECDQPNRRVEIILHGEKAQ